VRGPTARHPDDQREQLPAVEGTIADAAELKIGDRVVYPNQGVCAVVGVEEQDILGQKLQLVRMRREEDGAAVLVPKNKVPSIGLRRVATGAQMEGVFHYLAAQFDDPELDWKVRHRDNADRLIAGGVLGVAEVVKGLHSLSRIRPLPTKEREQYDNARHLLVHEIAVSLGVPAVLAEDFVDFALMPPAGVKFDLKPPPTPVLLPSRPKKRRPTAEEEDDLGLGDLGLDLDLAGALEGAAAGDGELPAGDGEGAEAAESGEGAETPDAGAGAGAGAENGTEAAAEGDEEGAPAAPAKGKAAPKAEKAARAKTPAPKPAAKPAKKPPVAKKAAKPAAKPAARPAAKAAPRRGGKKK
jgi:RNA polymerase-interacting CarD/CdnL/TRCF family regulator